MYVLHYSLQKQKLNVASEHWWEAIKNFNIIFSSDLLILTFIDKVKCECLVTQEIVFKS